MDGTMWYHSARTKAIEKRLRSGELGEVRRVTASFSFMAPAEWLEGGNNRTNKEKEPHGVLGDMGHYAISAILWAFDWVLPSTVQVIYQKINSVDTIESVEAVLLFPNGGRATLDVSVHCPHRSQFEICTSSHTIRVDDHVGGQGRSGDFSAYFVPYVGSSRYVLGDVTGKDEVVEVTASDHVSLKVEDLAECILAIKDGGAPNPEWPKRSIATHSVMCAIFESSEKGGAAISLGEPSVQPAAKAKAHPPAKKCAIQ